MTTYCTNIFVGKEDEPRVRLHGSSSPVFTIGQVVSIEVRNKNPEIWTPKPYHIRGRVEHIDHDVLISYPHDKSVQAIRTEYTLNVYLQAAYESSNSEGGYCI